MKPDLRWLSREKLPIWEAQGADHKDIIDTCSKAGDLMEGADSKGGRERMPGPDLARL